MNLLPIALEEMTDAEYERYFQATVEGYAAEGAKATGMTREAALARAHNQIAELLPDGRHTPGQYLRSILAASGERVGIFWYATPFDKSPPQLFVYDIEIDADHRGKGLGSAAMALLEVEARRLGAEEIALHVFTHNAGAIRLYERMGYVPTFRGEGGMQMTKALSVG
ncbi:MAG: GNAT family N-acetyltransferase [Planctomycetota bacterium]